jgi:hypothetical protein
VKRAVQASASAFALAIVAGCSGAGIWVRFGDDPNQSMAFSWSPSPRDPRWRCPKGEYQPSGIPTWIECDTSGREPLPVAADEARED